MTSRSCGRVISAKKRAQLTSRALSIATSCLSPRCVATQLPGSSTLHHHTSHHSPAQVWEQNPRYGGSKFLDGLWSAIDEVCLPVCPSSSAQAYHQSASPCAPQMVDSAKEHACTACDGTDILQDQAVPIPASPRQYHQPLCTIHPPHEAVMPQPLQGLRFANSP